MHTIMRPPMHARTHARRMCSGVGCALRCAAADPTGAGDEVVFLFANVTAGAIGYAHLTRTAAARSIRIGTDSAHPDPHGDLMGSPLRPTSARGPCSLTPAASAPGRWLGLACAHLHRDWLARSVHIVTGTWAPPTRISPGDGALPWLRHLRRLHRPSGAHPFGPRRCSACA